MSARSMLWLAALAAVAMLAQASAQTTPSLMSAEEAFLLMQDAGDDTASPAACCKVCSKGKACGDSCIARDRRCTKGVGCACDG